MTSPAIEPVPAEVPLLRLRRHGRSLVLPLLVLLVIAGFGGFWVGALPEPWMNWAAGLGGLALALLLGVAPLLRWLSNRTVITSRRVILRRGLLVHRRTEVPLGRVRGVRSRRGPVQRMLGSGHIELLVGADAPTVLQDVPGCATVMDALQELIERNFAGQGTDRVPAAGPEAAAPFDATRILPGRPVE